MSNCGGHTFCPITLHFPLRYFIYIGVTAIIRLIILYHDDPMHTLLFSLSILVLLVALYLANTKLLKRGE